MTRSPGFVRLPFYEPGMRIGLYGGTFDPPHEAHLLVARKALRRLRLDRIWWLVTPGNPLKEAAGRPTLADRLAAAQKLARHPRIVVTDAEEELGTRYTIDTIRALQRRCRGVHFVWIMGADNLTNFHRWGSWREIARRMPIAVIDRPGHTLKSLNAPAALGLRRSRIAEDDAPLLATLPPPAWVYLHGRRSPLSSTELRARAAAERRPAERAMPETIA